MKTSSASVFPTQPGTCEGDPAWLRAVLVFNLSPSAYAHPSWLPPQDDGSSGVVAADPTSAAARRRLSDNLLAQRGLSNAFLWQPIPLVVHPMLLSTPAWSELALCTGVMAHRNRLRQVVQRDVLSQWRELLGDRFDLLWSPLAERLPAVTSSARALPSLEAADQIREDGQAVLLGLLNRNDPALASAARRAQFRLPRGRALAADAWRPKVAQPDALVASLMDLLPRWSPHWTWLS